jgi:hypothetical protein
MLGQERRWRLPELAIGCVMKGRGRRLLLFEGGSDDADNGAMIESINAEKTWQFFDKWNGNCY